MLQMLQMLGLMMFWAAVLFCLLRLLRKTKLIQKNVRKKYFWAPIVVLCCILAVSSNFIITNHVLVFQTPESALRYARGGRIENVLYGDESYMIRSSRGIFFARRSDEGYRAPRGFSLTKRVAHRFDGLGSFRIYNVRDTNDHYLEGFFDSVENEVSIRDSNGEEIEHIDIHTEFFYAAGIYTVSLWMLVEDFTDDFYFYVNDDRIYFEELPPRNILARLIWP